MFNIQRLPVFICLAALFAGGCGESQPAPTANGGFIRHQNEGWSLLYKLMSDNKDVAKIFIFKHADDSVGSLVKEGAKFCDDTKTKMDQFSKDASARIEFDVPDLPKIEEASRDLEAKRDEKLLLGSSGKDFELALIFTQAQAMGYASQLSAALADGEQDATRKKFLQDTSSKASQLRDRLIQLLQVK